MTDAWAGIWPYLLTAFLTGIAVGLGIAAVKMAKTTGMIQP